MRKCQFCYYYVINEFKFIRVINIQGILPKGLLYKNPFEMAVKELFVPDGQLYKIHKDVHNLPRIELTVVDLQWLQVLSEGWATPLSGFMKEDELLQVMLKTSAKSSAFYVITIL